MTNNKNIRLEKNKIKTQKRDDILDQFLNWLDQYLPENQKVVDVVTLPGSSFIFENKVKDIAKLFPDVRFQLRCYENNKDIYRDSVNSYKEILPGFQCIEKSKLLSVFECDNVIITYRHTDFEVLASDDFIWFDCCGGWHKEDLNPFFEEINTPVKENRLVYMTASPNVRNYKTCHEYLTEDTLFFDKNGAFRELYEKEIKGDKSKILDYTYFGGENEEEGEGNLHCPMICIGYHTVKDSRLNLKRVEITKETIKNKLYV